MVTISSPLIIRVSRPWGYRVPGDVMVPAPEIALDFTDGTFRPGDRVRVEILRKPDILLSSYSYNA